MGKQQVCWKKRAPLWAREDTDKDSESRQKKTYEAFHEDQRILPALRRAARGSCQRSRTATSCRWREEGVPMSSIGGNDGLGSARSHKRTQIKNGLELQGPITCLRRQTRWTSQQQLTNTTCLLSSLSHQARANIKLVQAGRDGPERRQRPAVMAGLGPLMMALALACLLMLELSQGSGGGFGGVEAYEHHHEHHKKHYEAPIVKVIHKTVHIPKAIPVPKYIPVPKIIPVPKTVAVPHPVHISVKVPIYKTVKKIIPVPKKVHVHKPVPVPKPYAVAVPVPVIKHHPYPVYKYVPVHKPYGVPVPYKVAKHVPVGIPKVVHVPKPYPVPYKVPVYKEVIVKKPVEVPVPVYIKKKPVYHPPVYKHMHKKHHGHGHYAATNDHFTAVQPGNGGMAGQASQNLMVQQNSQQQYAQLQQPQQPQQQQLQQSYRPINGDESAASDKSHVQQPQQQQLMMTSASNLDSAGSSPTDLISQGSAPSALKQVPLQQHGEPNSGNNGANGAAVAAARPSVASENGKLPQHTFAPATDSMGQQQQQQQQQQMTLGPFQYHSNHNHHNHNQHHQASSLFAPRHLMMAQVAPSASETSPSGQIHAYNNGAASLDQSNSLNDSQQQQMLALQAALANQQQQQQQQQLLMQQSATNVQGGNGGGSKSALLNQLTRLWSIVGRQKSLLPSLASPFSSKTANMDQQQLQLLQPTARIQLASNNIGNSNQWEKRNE